MFMLPRLSRVSWSSWKNRDIVGGLEAWKIRLSFEGFCAMSRATVVTTLMILMPSLAACGLAVMQSNKSHLMNIQVGMSREELLAIMGTPGKREAYGRTEFLMYKTDVGNSDQEIYTPIALVDGKVAGWGRNYYDNAIRTKIEADIKVRQR
jgi:hypothetical protein